MSDGGERERGGDTRDEGDPDDDPDAGVLIDPDEHNDWKVEFRVDLEASRAAGEPIVRLCSIDSIARTNEG